MKSVLNPSRVLKGLVRRQTLPRAGALAQIRSFSGPIPQHKNTPDNNEDTTFDFTKENYERVNTILAKYPTNYKQSACIPLLDLAQRQNDNFLTLAAMNKVAEIIGVNPMRVYEVATFYTMFNREKVGKYFIQLCGTTPCQACGAGEIKETIQNHLGLGPGEEHTKDGLFTLREVECLGACVNAPMVQLNDDFYEQLTPETTVELLEACKAGKPPALTKWGSLPMNGQLSCEGPLGKTSLFDEPPGPGAHMRPDNELVPDEKKEGYLSPEQLKDHMYY
mmetsp:Transcript_15664/g.18983  ORF Transcript_15664/g.18983 Transcript_15664/m.18983 type:complete len:278 (+) Transcript_15664:326-1159(+)